MIDYSKPIYKRLDNSFVATIENVPYHIKPAQKYYSELLSYSLLNPDLVIDITPLPEATLEIHKEAHWESIKEFRENQKRKGFLFNGIRFDGDEKAQTNISNAAITAMVCQTMGYPYQVGWTSYDNNLIQLDAVGMLGLQTTMTQNGANIHSYASQLRDRILEAKDKAELMNITWEYDENQQY